MRSLSSPLGPRSRWLLLLLVAPVLVAVIAPLWELRFETPRHPEGLALELFSYTVSGDVAEVNALNRSLGLRAIDRAALSDFDLLPFGLGLLALLLLRAAALGDLRALVDLVALYVYFGAFALGRVAYRLWVFGHQLEPGAALREPFTPPLLGTLTIADVSVTSLPGRGSLYLALVAAALLALVIANLRGRAAAG